MKIKAFSILALLLVLSSACTSSTRLTPLWVDDDYNRGQIKQVIVVAIVQDSLIRRGTEYHVKKQLKEMGVNAISSLEVLSAKEKITEERFKKIFDDYDIDGIITIRKIGVDTQTTTGYSYNNTPGVVHVGFYGYYSTYFASSSQYTIRDKIVKIECNLFDTLDEKMIWSGMFETKNPHKLSDVIIPLSEMIGDELAGGGYFVAK